MQTACPKCGTVNRAGARFCSRCGTALTAPQPLPPVPRPTPAQTPPPAPVIPPARPTAPSRGAPTRQAIIVLAIVLIACVSVMIVGGGTYIYTQAFSATPTPGMNIKTVVAPIQSQIPAIQTKLPEIQTKIPEIQTKLPEIQTALPIPSGIPTFELPTGIPNIPGLPGFLATPTPKP